VALGLPSVLPNSQPAIGDLIRGPRPTFSFEFFPPKTADGERLLWRAIRELEPLLPSFVSITYGAGGSTRDTTVALTERIATETTLLPMAHLTAVNHSVAELRNVIGRLAGAGVHNVLAIRGDPPGDPTGEVGPASRGRAVRRGPGPPGPGRGRFQRRGGGLPVQASALARHRQ
jgi:methylenetetrahydrofolate reductase (NADPH)